MSDGVLSHRCLCSHGYVVGKKLISNPQLKKILTQLMITPKVDSFYAEFAPPSTYPIFLHDHENYYLPRYWATEIFGPPKFLRLPKGQPIDITIKFDPLPHQLTAWKKIQEQFVPGRQLGGGGVLSLPCGYGKTYLAIRTAVRLKLKTLVIVHQEFFLDQWQKAIEQYSSAKVGRIQGSLIDVEGKDIVIGMLQSISGNRDYGDLFDQFGFVIVDEVHHIGSEKFSRALPKIHTRYMLGLSATPERKDGTSKVFYHTIGPLFHSEKRTTCNNVKIIQIPLKSKTSHYKRVTMRSPSGKVRVNTKRMSINLTESPARNQLIQAFIDRIMTDPNRQVLVLSEVRNHLHILGEYYEANPVKHTGQLLSETAPPFAKASHSTYGYYYGRQGENKEACRARREQSAKSQLVLGTNQLAKEGLDIATLNCLVFASPAGTDVDQAVGRILRKYNFDTPPLILDLVDECGNFSRAGNSRAKYYMEMGYQLVKAKPITLAAALSKQNLDELEAALIAAPETSASTTETHDTDAPQVKPKRIRRCLLKTTTNKISTKPSTKPSAKPLVNADMSTTPSPKLSLKTSTTRSFVKTPHRASLTNKATPSKATSFVKTPVKKRGAVGRKRVVRVSFKEQLSRAKLKK